jgi:hypothetical protein
MTGYGIMRGADMGMKACMQYGVYGDILELAERFVLDTVHEQWQFEGDDRG